MVKYSHNILVFVVFGLFWAILALRGSREADLAQKEQKVTERRKRTVLTETAERPHRDA